MGAQHAPPAGHRLYYRSLQVERGAAALTSLVDTTGLDDGHLGYSERWELLELRCVMLNFEPRAGIAATLHVSDCPRSEC